LFCTNSRANYYAFYAIHPFNGAIRHNSSRLSGLKTKTRLVASGASPQWLFVEDIPIKETKGITDLF